MMMIPMVIMSAVDVVAPAFLSSPGIVFAYIMNDPYRHPQIAITFFWEGAQAIFGLWLFFVVWGSWLSVKSKPNTELKIESNF